MICFVLWTPRPKYRSTQSRSNHRTYRSRQSRCRSSRRNTLGCDREVGICTSTPSVPSTRREPGVGWEPPDLQSALATQKDPTHKRKTSFSYAWWFLSVSILLAAIYVCVPVCIILSRLLQSIPVCSSQCQSAPVCTNLALSIPKSASDFTSLPSLYQYASDCHNLVSPPQSMPV